MSHNFNSTRKKLRNDAAIAPDMPAAPTMKTPPVNDNNSSKIIHATSESSTLNYPLPVTLISHAFLWSIGFISGLVFTKGVGLPVLLVIPVALAMVYIVVRYLMRKSSPSIELEWMLIGEDEVQEQTKLIQEWDFAEEVAKKIAARGYEVFSDRDIVQFYKDNKKKGIVKCVGLGWNVTPAMVRDISEAAQRDRIKGFIAAAGNLQPGTEQFLDRLNVKLIRMPPESLQLKPNLAFPTYSNQ